MEERDRDIERIPLVEEEARIEKREVVGGRVRVRSTVETFEETVKASLRDERVEVTRVPVGRDVAEAPSVRNDGDVTIIPVVEEVLVVEKRLHLKEEIHIRRHASEEAVEVPVTLRRQRAEIERIEAETADETTR